MQGIAPTPVSPSRIALACAAALLAFGAAPAAAQEGVLSGLGWLSVRPGAELKADSRVQNTGNTAAADITSGGGEVNLGAGLLGSLRLVTTVQVNTIGLAALNVEGTQLDVLHNRVQGFVSAIGGAASANTLLIAGGTSRQALAHSALQVQRNTASNVQAHGGSASLLLGAGSLQLPGRAAANSLLADDSALRRARVDVAHNQAQDIGALGGSTLANASTVARSDIDDLQLLQERNRAHSLRSGGVAGSLGWGAIAEMDLRGVAAGNAVLLAHARVRGARLIQQANTVDGVSALGGSALANSLNLDAAGTEGLHDYQTVQQRNEARQVHARGAQASLLGGALASLSAGAAALANSVSLQGSTLQAGARHALVRNRADGVQAVGGAAAANSIWLQQSQARASPIVLADNSATAIDTAGGGVSIGAGVVGNFQRNGRSLANSVALDNAAALNDSATTLVRNTASAVQGAGGVATANSVLLSGGTVQGTPLTLGDNQAQSVQATGFSGSVGAGLLFSAEQQALALANSLGVFGSTVDAAALTLVGNRASALSAQGGKLIANSVSVEAEGAASRLSGSTSLQHNTADQVSTGASATSGPLHAFSSESKARAAVNALVLRTDAALERDTHLRIAHNRAVQVGAVGGTALVNSLAAYNGARVAGSSIALAHNQAQDVRAGGGYAQALGIGQAKNGILVANGLYMEGGDTAVRLQGAAVAVQHNQAHALDADGGRLNANALAINGQGDVNGTPVTLRGNRASGIASRGEEGTFAGMAVVDRGVGHANANAVQVLGTLRDGSLALLGNVARDVLATKGMALANSVALEGSAQRMRAMVAGNTAEGVHTADGLAAVASSVLNEGELDDARIVVMRNTGGARAEQDDAASASVRNRAAGRITGNTQVTVLGNRGHVQGSGTLNTLDNHQQLAGSQVAIVRNQGNVREGGIVNSVINGGRVSASQIVVLGNTGSAVRGGVVNSVINGRQGEMRGARIALVGNTGSALEGGIVNSVDNRGLLTGQVDIVGNRGTVSQGGIANSLINEGRMTGRVQISGNTGTASGSGIANSVINRGEVSGTITIQGSNATAGAGQTLGSQRTGGDGVVLRTVTVGAGGVGYGS